MPDFDPGNIGPFVPTGFRILADAVREIIEAGERAAVDAANDMLSSEILEDDIYDIVTEEKQSIELGIATGSIFLDHDRLNLGWRSLWSHLIDGSCQTIAVDDDCNVFDVDAYYWTTAFATRTFASGVILHHPPYRPRGRVYISNDEIFKLQDVHYRIRYRYIMPTMSGVNSTHDDTLKFFDLYESSRFGLFESLQSSKSTGRAIHDKEVFLIEIFAIISERGIFKSKSELSGLAIDAYQRVRPQESRPSKRWADDLIKRVWERLGLKDTPVSELRKAGIATGKNLAIVNDL